MLRLFEIIFCRGELKRISQARHFLVVLASALICSKREIDGGGNRQFGGGGEWTDLGESEQRN